MGLIYKNSPFKDINQIFAQFNKITNKASNLLFQSLVNLRFSIDPMRKDLILMRDTIDNSEINMRVKT
jgi:hypothetical protein